MSDNPQQLILASLHRAIFSIGKVKKGERNPLFDSTYSSLESVLDIVNPAIHEQGLVMSQVPGFDAPANAVTMSLSFIDAEGNLLNYATSHLPLGKIYKKDGTVQECNAQNATAAQTYLARTQVGHVFRLTFTDDDGNSAAGTEKERPRIDAPVRPGLSLVRKEEPKKGEAPAINQPDISWDIPEDTAPAVPATVYKFKGRDWNIKTMSPKQLAAPTFSSGSLYPEDFKHACKKELLKRVAEGDPLAIDIVNSNS